MLKLGNNNSNNKSNNKIITININNNNNRDGTTSVVLLAAEILKECKDFIEDGLHPRVIIKGLREVKSIRTMNNNKF